MFINFHGSIFDTEQIVFATKYHLPTPPFTESLEIHFDTRVVSTLYIDGDSDALSDELWQILREQQLTYVPEPDPEPEDGEPILTEEERVILQNVYDAGYKFVARDKDGKLWAFRNEPTFDGYYWNDGTTDAVKIKDVEMDFLTWDAEKAPSIAFLLLVS